jgi:mannose-6-phosphate isomerase-like protein (cupin superfamily)
MITYQGDHYEVIKKWGREIWIENNDLYCCKILICKDKIWSSEGKFHMHKKKDEAFLCQTGLLELDVIDPLAPTKQEFILKPGDSIRISPGVWHRFRSYTDICQFIETSTHHEDSDSYRRSMDDILIKGELR